MDSPGKSTGVSCHALLQGIFSTQGSNLSLLGLLHWEVGSLPTGTAEKPFIYHLHAKSLQLCLFPTLWIVARQAPLSMGFSRQEYWSGLPCPPPDTLPQGLNLHLLSPALAGGFCTTIPTGEALHPKFINPV